MRPITVGWFIAIFFVLSFGRFGFTNGTEIAYSVRWQRPNTHYFQISIKIKSTGKENLVLRLPAWRPGRYTIQNYARNVVDFTARDQEGRLLTVRKTDKQSWQVEPGEAKAIEVYYRYYAHQLDGGSSYLDEDEAYINPITLLMYIPGGEMRPATLRLMRPEGWRVATVLPYDSSNSIYRSATYHELVDEPILISPSFRRFSFQEDGTRFDLVFQGRGNPDSSRIIRDVRKIVAAEKAVFGRYPFKRYMFLFHLLPTRFGHGVEHRNATSIVLGPTDFKNPKFYQGFLGVIAHEFFHVWNVERIRPKAIFYPDYSVENYTRLMWFFEGVTSYYDMMVRLWSGLTTREKFYKNLAGRLRRLEKSWNIKQESVSLSSWDSWITGYGGAPPHTQLSFYSTGQALGLFLDLKIRHLTANKKSLDDVMRYLYRRYAAKNRGVPEDGIRKAVEEVSGADFSAFFDKYVDGNARLSAASFLEYAGLEVGAKADSGKPAVATGFRLDKDGRIRDIWPNSAAEKAGMDLNDRILALNGRQITGKNLSKILMKYQPGDTVQIAFFRKDSLRSAKIIFNGGANLEYQIEEVQNPTPLQKSILQGWLHSKSGEAEKKAAG